MLYPPGFIAAKKKQKKPMLSQSFSNIFHQNQGPFSSDPYFRINLETFGTLKGTLFHKPVTGQAVLLGCNMVHITNWL